jgi:hypothetical protein
MGHCTQNRKKERTKERKKERSKIRKIRRKKEGRGVRESERRRRRMAETFVILRRCICWRDNLPLNLAGDDYIR